MPHPSAHKRTEVTYNVAELAASLGITREQIKAGVDSGHLVVAHRLGAAASFTQPAIGAWLDTLALDLEVQMLGGPMQIARAWQAAAPAVRQRVRPAAVSTAMGTLTTALVHWVAGLGADGNPWDQPAIPMGESHQAEV